MDRYFNITIQEPIGGIKEVILSQTNEVLIFFVKLILLNVATRQSRHKNKIVLGEVLSVLIIFIKKVFLAINFLNFFVGVQDLFLVFTENFFDRNFINLFRILNYKGIIVENII